MSEPFDLGRFEARRAAPKPKRRRYPVELSYSDAFISWPVRAGWLLHLTTLGKTTRRLGVLLWCIAGRNGSLSFKATNATLSRLGISPDAKLRGLKSLEAAGLISLERRGRGKNPVVTILPHAGPEVSFDD